MLDTVDIDCVVNILSKQVMLLTVLPIFQISVPVYVLYVSSLSHLLLLLSSSHSFLCFFFFSVFVSLLHHLSPTKYLSPLYFLRSPFFTHPFYHSPSTPLPSLPYHHITPLLHSPSVYFIFSFSSSSITPLTHHLSFHLGGWRCSTIRIGHCKTEAAPNSRWDLTCL